MTRAQPSRLLLWYLCAAAFAVFVYFFGLDSQHIPKNGDEYPYTHITRMTAESGRLLSLQSTLDNLRNTKPPLLFWQGITSTGWAEQWTLFNLRFPSVIYTLMTAGLVVALARRISGRWETGLLAALTWLAFFTTYRYGRPFLTNSPEVFWLFAPIFVLTYWREQALRSKLLVPLALGLMIGIALLYKSFALVLPAGVALTWYYWFQRGYDPLAFLLRDAYKIAIACSLALAMFGLWFVFDPDPRAIWQEFVLEENFGKLEQKRSYLSQMLWGKNSVWALALSYPVNAAFLAPPIVALVVVAIRRRGSLSAEEKILWIWVLSLIIVFMLPSQRSGRYLLSGMPALAILLALSWDRIPSWVYRISLVLVAIPIAVLIYFSISLETLFENDSLYGAGAWLLYAAFALAVIACLLFSRLIKPLLSTVVIAGFLAGAVFLRPFDGPLGQYPASVQAQVEGKTVLVPYNYNAKYERYRFMLPGAHIEGYRVKRKQPVDPAALLDKYQRVAIPLTPGERPCTDCRILGERMDLRTRLSSGQIRQVLLEGDLRPLVAREFLVEREQD